MTRMELSCRRFAVFGGMQIDTSPYSVCVHPIAQVLQKRGTLALISEPVGSVALGADACRLAQHTVVEGYFSDHSLGLTSSLLNALDAANNALLQYGSGWTGTDSDDNAPGGNVAVQTNTKTKRVRVGMTALLIRPDGTGVYLSQMAPTQAYILHNGLLSALPEPEGWFPSPGRTVVTLKRVLTEEEEDQEEEELQLPDLSNVVVPAPALGSGPGVEADLIYRRIEPGDRIVLVSSGLARHIERQWAEQAFAYDADSVIATLVDLAQEKGLAEAHACVLALGVPTSSGVDTDYITSIAPKAGLQVAQAGGVSAAPHEPEKPAPGAGLIEALRGPRDWLARRKPDSEPTGEAADSRQAAPAEWEPQPQPQPEPHKPSWEGLDDAGEEPEPLLEPEDEGEMWSRQPTQLFIQQSPEIPPFHARAESAPENMPEPGDEELQFDGWEDSPPALDVPRYAATHRVIFKPKVQDDPDQEDFSAPSYKGHSPGIYDEPFDDQSVQPTPTIQPARTKAQGINFAAVGRQLAAWGSQALAAVIPQRAGTTPRATRQRTGQRMLLPLRLVILGALALVGIILVVSLLSMRGSAEQAATNNLLAQAQQLQTAANQQGLTDTERVQKLQLALDKAKEAAAANPESDEATRLVGQLSTDLDTAQGVTRLSSLKLLFDLDAIDNLDVPATTEIGAPATQDSTSTDPGESPAPTYRDDLIVQGNNVYILDRAKSWVYRCQVAAKSCSVVLSEGDTIGGQKVGVPAAITSRVGSPVVLDESLVSYVFSADTGAWLAEPLGGADGLQKSISMGSYDGNLYLLGSKPGQISKYISGQYSEPPIDWITDGPTSDAMKEPTAMAIDGAIYVALSDGHILVMQGGKMTGTFTPKNVADGGPPTEIVTNTDIQNIYILRSADDSITRLDKEGQTLAIYKAPTDSGLTDFSALAVDEGHSKVYLSIGRKVYQANLPGSGARIAPPPAAENEPQLPTSQPAQPQQEAPAATDDPSAMPTVVP